MLFIRRQYDAQEAELDVRDDLVFARPHREQRVVIPVNGINRAVVQAVNFGRSLRRRDVQAIFVTDDPDEAEALRDRWERQLPGVPLVIVESPYRALIAPVVAYLDVLDQAWPPDRRRRSRSSCCPSTSPATGGTGCCTTRPPSGSRRRSSAASTRSSRTCPIGGAIT